MSLSLDVITWETMLMLISVCALSAYAGTEVVRQLLNGWTRHSKKEKAWWQPGLLKSISVVLGGAAGYFLGESLLGLVVGVGAGGITTSVVGAVKARIKGGGSGQ
jgi:VIT1/CCC1 family predicted Fe2+/Mn2+ transporter